MLKELTIQNIILIEHAQIQFEHGFNVLSGESGSGKSAIMEALQLALGGRTDTALIRSGVEKGSVEAIFDLTLLPNCSHFLAEKGLETDDPKCLIIRREISSSGKTRAFVNQYSVQLSVLKQLGDYLLELVGQHANHKLFELSHQRDLLDLYGSLMPLRKTYLEEWQNWQRLCQELQTLRASLPSALREIESCEREISEIEEARFKEDEDDQLYQEYSLLASVEERCQAAKEIEDVLGNVLSLLRKSKHSVQLLQQKDPTFEKQLAPITEVQLEIQELLHVLERYTNQLDANPAKLEKLNERLTLFSKLKRKFGPSLADIQAHLKSQKERLSLLQDLENKIFQLEEKHQNAHLKIKNLASDLSQKRKQTASNLDQKITEQLSQLNMPQAQFRTDIVADELTSFGGDRIEFCLASNMGEKEIPLKEGISGGELARVLLSLHLLLAGKEQLGTLIFDEIDANIGGTTASQIGLKLKELGKNLQVLCITHFPQVAEVADHHLHIIKTNLQGRTFSQVSILNSSTRPQELARMRGKQH